MSLCDPIINVSAFYYDTESIRVWVFVTQLLMCHQRSIMTLSQYAGESVDWIIKVSSFYYDTETIRVWVCVTQLLMCRRSIMTLSQYAVESVWPNYWSVIVLLWHWVNTRLSLCDPIIDVSSFYYDTESIRVWVCVTQLLMCHRSIMTLSQYAFESVWPNSARR